MTRNRNQNRVDGCVFDSLEHRNLLAADVIDVVVEQDSDADGAANYIRTQTSTYDERGHLLHTGESK